jgi:hypothetical protein
LGTCSFAGSCSIPISAAGTGPACLTAAARAAAAAAPCHAGQPERSPVHVRWQLQQQQELAQQQQQQPSPPASERHSQSAASEVFPCELDGQQEETKSVKYVKGRFTVVQQTTPTSSRPVSRASSAIPTPRTVSPGADVIAESAAAAAAAAAASAASAPSVAAAAATQLAQEQQAHAAGAQCRTCATPPGGTDSRASVDVDGPKHAGALQQQGGVGTGVRVGSPFEAASSSTSRVHFEPRDPPLDAVSISAAVAAASTASQGTDHHTVGVSEGSNNTSSQQPAAQTVRWQNEDAEGPLQPLQANPLWEGSSGQGTELTEAVNTTLSTAQARSALLQVVDAVAVVKQPAASPSKGIYAAASKVPPPPPPLPPMQQQQHRQLPVRVSAAPQQREQGTGAAGAGGLATPWRLSAEQQQQVQQREQGAGPAGLATPRRASYFNSAEQQQQQQQVSPRVSSCRLSSDSQQQQQQQQQQQASWCSTSPSRRSSAGDGPPAAATAAAGAGAAATTSSLSPTASLHLHQQLVFSPMRLGSAGGGTPGSAGGAGAGETAAAAAAVAAAAQLSGEEATAQQLVFGPLRLSHTSLPVPALAKGSFTGRAGPGDGAVDRVDAGDTLPANAAGSSARSSAEASSEGLQRTLRAVGDGVNAEGPVTQLGTTHRSSEQWSQQQQEQQQQWDLQGGSQELQDLHSQGVLEASCSGSCASGVSGDASSRMLGDTSQQQQEGVQQPQQQGQPAVPPPPAAAGVWDALAAPGGAGSVEPPSPAAFNVQQRQQQQLTMLQWEQAVFSPLRSGTAAAASTASPSPGFTQSTGVGLSQVEGSNHSRREEVVFSPLKLAAASPSFSGSRALGVNTPSPSTSVQLSPQRLMRPQQQQQQGSRASNTPPLSVGPLGSFAGAAGAAGAAGSSSNQQQSQLVLLPGGGAIGPLHSNLGQHAGGGAVAARGGGSSLASSVHMGLLLSPATRLSLGGASTIDEAVWSSGRPSLSTTDGGGEQGRLSIGPGAAEGLNAAAAAAGGVGGAGLAAGPSGAAAAAATAAAAAAAAVGSKPTVMASWSSLSSNASGVRVPRLSLPPTLHVPDAPVPGAGNRSGSSSFRGAEAVAGPQAGPLAANRHQLQQQQQRLLQTQELPSSAEQLQGSDGQYAAAVDSGNVPDEAAAAAAVAAGQHQPNFTVKAKGAGASPPLPPPPPELLMHLRQSQQQQQQQAFSAVGPSTGMTVGASSSVAAATPADADSPPQGRQQQPSTLTLAGLVPAATQSVGRTGSFGKSSSGAAGRLPQGIGSCRVSGAGAAADRDKLVSKVGGCWVV